MCHQVVHQKTCSCEEEKVAQDLEVHAEFEITELHVAIASCELSNEYVGTAGLPIQHVQAHTFSDAHRTCKVMSTHGIRIPGQILDQLRTQSERNGQDERVFENRKRKVSRKDKRKEERLSKKQKRSQKGRNESLGSNGVSKKKVDTANLQKKSTPSNKVEKKGNISVASRNGHLESEDENDSSGLDGDSDEQLDLGSESGGDFNNEFDEDIGSDSGSDDDYGELEMVDNPLEQLRKLKDGKNKKKDTESPLEQLRKIKEAKKHKKMVEEDPLEQLRMIKEAKHKAKEDTKKPKNDPPARHVDNQVAAQLKKDDEEIAHYSKVLGLKGGKKGKLKAQDENDFVGGLFDGLDFMDDFGSADTSEVSEGSEVSDEELSDSFNSNNSESEIDSDADSDSGPSENPYVAPTKYVPPAVRRQQENENAEISALKRAIKGPLNRLSESSISTVVNEIIGQYSSYPRQVVNETLTAIIINSIVLQDRLLDTFVYLHAAVVAAVYRIRGIDFGAYFIQTLVEKFDSCASGDKTRYNIITLLSSVYALGLVSANLIYDFVKLFIEDLTEGNAEILLRLIRTSGNQLRSEDPAALKEIVLLTNKAAGDIPKEKKSTRLLFLVDTISSLKNNKLKIHSESTFQLITRLRKYLSTLKSSKLTEAIQVSISDIRNVDSQGKWWLVGSAWKGKEVDEDVAINDKIDMDLSEPNWLELAKAQRMNTDIRRAIFISIMSAEDYMDALTKLDKLGLKKAQQKEIPRILVHCTGVEPAWNPYYGLLASKLCENHSHRKSLQFLLWDLLKELDGSQDDFEDFDNDLNDTLDDEAKLKRVLNLGRFFGYLFSEESLPLHLLKNVNFLTATGDLTVFLELTLITLFDRVSKKAKRNKSADDTLYLSLLTKLKDETTLMKGLQMFTEKIQKSEYISTDKQRARVNLGIESAAAILDELIANSDNAL